MVLDQEYGVRSLPPRLRGGDQRGRGSAALASSTKWCRSLSLTSLRPKVGVYSRRSSSSSSMYPFSSRYGRGRLSPKGGSSEAGSL
eukprot:194162-Rhodomonas_salina.1